MKEITSLELVYIIDELKFLKGARIEKIYQNVDELRIKLYSPKYGSYTLFASPDRIHLISEKKEPEEPSNFAMLLRKHFNGKIIESIEQHNFDRVIEIVTPDRILIIESFQKGNIILTDGTYNTIMPLRIQKWRDREIAPKKKYDFPSESKSIVDDFLQFKRNAYKSDKKIIAFLYTMGFGKYAEEICLLSGINKDIISQKLKKEELEKVFHNMKSIINKEKKAQIIFENDKMMDATPFDIKMYENHKKEYYDSFNKALDILYKENVAKEREIQNEKIIEERKEKVERILEQQEKAIENFKEDEEEKRNEADIIYRYYDLVSNILAALKKARESHEWSEIKQMIEKEDTPETTAIKEIRDQEGIVVVTLEDQDIEIKINRSVEENAAELYEKAKKNKRKKKTATEQIEKTKEKLEQINEDVEIEKPDKVVSKRKRWYEKEFRYFWSLDSLLVVAGKDAETNEKLVKKHTESSDIVLHADIQGAPFVVIKQRKDKRYKPEELTPQGIVEAAEFAASYSKAWQLGYGSVEVYWVKPEQIDKNSPTGEQVKKGTFIVHGEKNYLKKIKLRLGVGADLKEKRFVVGPVKTVGSRYSYYITIVPGDMPAYDLAKQIKQKLVIKSLYPDEKDIIENMPIEDIQNNIPSARGMLVE